MQVKKCVGRGRCVCVALGFGLAPSLWTFIPPFAIGELALFSIQARVSNMAGSTLASLPNLHHIPAESALLYLLLSWALCAWRVSASPTALQLVRMHQTSGPPEQRQHHPQAG